jgi:hypothetical protein
MADWLALGDVERVAERAEKLGKPHLPRVPVAVIRIDERQRHGQNLCYPRGMIGRSCFTIGFRFPAIVGQDERTLCRFRSN